MPRNRASQISLQDTPYYHCISRCVRRGFLCGTDPATGKCYEHRRQWIESRLLFLANVFTIDICAYAVMSNHTHVVLHVDTQMAQSLSAEAILRRYHLLYKGTVQTHLYLDPELRSKLSDAELKAVEDIIEICRERLHNISWFMAALNEYIARLANKEDECTGRFWEGRFKSQALLDDSALLSCMAYVDLNPVRAGLATTPENSEYTSVKKRAEALRYKQQPSCLMPFENGQKQTDIPHLNFELIDYLRLVDETGRVMREDKFGKIGDIPDILQRLGLNNKAWQTLTTEFERHFSAAAGREHMLRKFHHHKNSKRAHGVSKAALLFGP